MEDYFWYLQQENNKNKYIDHLKIIGSLSSLFSDSTNPYLYYRAHENLFCDVFNAKNLSRGDVSFDAVSGKIGIGLKTFLNGNGQTFQKVAEFNSDSNIIRTFDSNEEIIHKVADLRNKRIKVTENLTDTTQNIYHIVTRDKGKMNIIETPMDYIDFNSIKIPKTQGKNTIKFNDKYNEYSYSLSKNTLLKRFDTTQSEIITQFEVEILDNPFDFLRQSSVFLHSKKEVLAEENYIILPLYSSQLKDVPKKSGLNQWNADGRKRDINEVYIQIPTWIHNIFSDFFVYSRLYRGQSAKKSPSFEVELPSGDVMSCKVAQSGGKALMSNPNKALGKWILRDILNLKEGVPVTMKMLNDIGIDSIKLTKKNDNYYSLDFMKSGSYEEFEQSNKK